MSFLEDALFIVNGTRQSAAHMSEKFALKQGLRQGGAIDGDKGMISPLAVMVQRLGYELLARAGLPLNQNRGVALCHHADHTENRPHRFALTDDRLKVEVQLQLTAQPFHLARQPMQLEGFLDHEFELFDIERLD